MLLSIFAFALIQTQSSPRQPAAPTASTGVQWKTVASKTGPSISVPIDLGKSVLSGGTSQAPSTESFSPKAWEGCSLTLSKQPFGKEDPTDTAAVKLEDVVYSGLDMDEDRIAGVSFSILQGWPVVDIAGKRKDGTQFHTKVCRTRSLNYVMVLKGASLPSDDIVQRLFDSYRLPKEIAQGSWSKWAPVPGEAKLADGKLNVWTPIPFKDSDDFPDLGDNEIKGEAHEGEFGYTTYRVAIVELPPGMEDHMDDSAVDRLIRSEFEGDSDDEGGKVAFGAFKTISSYPQSAGRNLSGLFRFPGGSFQGRESSWLALQ